MGKHFITEKTDTAATASVNSNQIKLQKLYTAKLQKILYDAKYTIDDYSVRVMRILYRDQNGDSVIRQIYFDGSLSYGDCLKQIPMRLDNTHFTLRKIRIAKDIDLRKN